MHSKPDDIQGVQGSNRRLELATDIRGIWPSVRHGVEKIAERGGNGWIAEDVYSALQAGQASLFFCITDNRADGFLILQQNQTFRGKELYMWGAYADKGDIVATHLELVKDMAVESGCVAVSFMSPRLGAERRSRPYGFVVDQVSYRLEV